MMRLRGWAGQDDHSFGIESLERARVTAARLSA